MSADLSDPNIVAKYQEITSFTSPTNWLLLSYGQSRDKLSLFASGEGGIEELRPNLRGDVFFALVREDRSFILISFVPEDISGVRRARALVHSRAVGSLFKAHHAAWTITKAEALTEDAVRGKLKLPPTTDGYGYGSSSSVSVSTPTVPSNFPSLGYSNGRHVSSPTEASISDSSRRLRASDGSAAAGPQQQQFSPPTSPARRRMVSDQISVHSTGSGAPSPSRDLPPPPPTLTIPRQHTGPPVQTPTPISPGPAIAAETIARARTPDSMRGPLVAHSPPPRSGSTPTLMVTPVEKKNSSAGPPLTAAQEQAAQSRAKWAVDHENERRVLQRQRSQLEMQREAEAEQQALFDAERSARLKMEREEAMRAEMDEDDRRKLVEQEHARRLAADRAAEEQRRRDEVNQKKAMEAQRRREEVAARIKREKEEQLERERLALEKQKEEEQQLAAKRNIQAQFSNLRSAGAIMLTGNLTTQAHDSMYWRRRYFELSSQGLAFYKSSDTLANRLDQLPLEGRVRAITEKNDELQSIPNSFAIEFLDGTIQLFFCDTKEDKELLTSAILQVTKL